MEALHHQDFPVELQLHTGRVPVSVSHVGLFDDESPAFIEPAEDPPTEIHVSEQGAVDLCQPHDMGIDPDLALHSLETLGLAIGRNEVRIR